MSAPCHWLRRAVFSNLPKVLLVGIQAQLLATNAGVGSKSSFLKHIDACDLIEPTCLCLESTLEKFRQGFQQDGGLLVDRRVFRQHWFFARHKLGVGFHCISRCI